MMISKCLKCNLNLYINENHTYEGCRDTEEIYCPKCNSFITTVSTSGFSSVEIISDSQIEEMQKGIDGMFGKGFNLKK